MKRKMICLKGGFFLGDDIFLKNVYSIVNLKFEFTSGEVSSSPLVLFRILYHASDNQECCWLGARAGKQSVGSELSSPFCYLRIYGSWLLKKHIDHME